MIDKLDLVPIERGSMPLKDYQDIINARMRGVISTFKDLDGVIYYDEKDYKRYKAGEKKQRLWLGALLDTVADDVKVVIIPAAFYETVGYDFFGTVSEFKHLPGYRDYYSSRVLKSIEVGYNNELQVYYL